MNVETQVELDRVRAQLRAGVERHIRSRRRRRRSLTSIAVLAALATTAVSAVAAAPESPVGRAVLAADVAGFLDFAAEDDGEPGTVTAVVDDGEHGVVAVSSGGGKDCFVGSTGNANTEAACSQEQTAAGLKTLSFGASEGREVLRGIVAGDVDTVTVVLGDGTSRPVALSDGAFLWTAPDASTSVRRVDAVRAGRSETLVSERVIALLRTPPKNDAQ